MNAEWNRALKRLIWRNLGKDAEIPDECYSLFQSISDSFDTHDKEYALLNRIMDLSSEELFAANTELRKRNEELDHFVYSTSHDLRAPLTSILGLVQLIELTDDAESKATYLEKIKTSTLQLDSFIQEIVSYTHNKKVEILSELVDFDSLITKCISRLSFMNTSTNIEKIIDVEVDIDFYSDPQRIDNLLSNLVSNSIKYHNPESEAPFVKISVRSEKGKAIIKIEDNGIGIKKENQKKIFDMFYRASAQSKGSGIGLYIVREIVEKLSGSVKVSSILGEGTIFTISLPNRA